MPEETKPETTAPMEGLDEGPRNFVLTHGQLASRRERGNNEKAFRNDVERGAHRNYEPGDWVAYHKGIHCGHAEDREALEGKATAYFGRSSLGVFPVPEDGNVDEAVEEGVNYETTPDIR